MLGKIILNELIIFGTSIRSQVFYVLIVIKIHFFRVSVTIGLIHSLLRVDYDGLFNSEISEIRTPYKLTQHRFKRGIQVLYKRESI